MEVIRKSVARQVMYAKGKVCGQAALEALEALVVALIRRACQNANGKKRVKPEDIEIIRLVNSVE